MVLLVLLNNMECLMQLHWIFALVFVSTVMGQMNSFMDNLPELLTTCPETCPWRSTQSSVTDLTSWCSDVDFSEPSYQTRLPKCKNVTLKSSDFFISENGILVLQKNGFRVTFRDFQLAHDKNSANVCFFLNPQLHSCSLKQLDRRLYTYDGSLLALRNCKTKQLIALGDFYVLPDSKAIVACRESLGYHLNLQDRCEYISLSPTEYEFLDENTTIRLLQSNSTVNQALYGPIKSTPNISLCFPLSVEMAKCEKFEMYSHEYRLNPDRSVFIFRIRKHLHLGDYKSLPKEKVLYCQSVHVNRHVDPVYYYCHIVQIISAFFVILAIVIHFLVPSINYHAKPLVCQMFSLAVWFIAGPYRFLWYPETEIGCYVVFVFFYISALTSFFWLNVLAFDLWSIFANLQTSSMQLCANMCHKKPKFLLYCAYAYVIPLLMTILSLLLEMQPSMQDALGLRPHISAHCWFTEAKSLYLFYSGPIFFLLCVNMVLFGLTVCNLRQASQGVAMVNKKRNKQLFLVCIKIFVIMGLCWILEFITFLADWRGAASYPALIAMSIQGILLFIIYICKPSTYRTLRRKVEGSISSKNKKSTDPISQKGAGNSNSSSSGISMETMVNSEETQGKNTSG